MPQLAAVLLLALFQRLEPDGFIKGLAVDSVTGQGIEGVSIRVAGGSAAAVSGAGGAFVLRVKPGEYTILFEKRGYIGSNYATVSSPRVRVSAAEEKSVRLEIAPACYLAGRVLGEEGEALTGVFVYARRSFFGESPIMDQTARDGRFQLADLAPGSYKLQVRIPEGLRKSKKVVADGVTSSYLPVFWYPGVSDPNAAVSVDLAPGQRLPGFDFRMRRVPLAALKIHVTAPGVEARLRAAGDPDWTERRVDGDGEARFDLMAPGEYELALYAGDASRTLPFLRKIHLTPPEAEVQIAMPRVAPVRGRVTGKARYPVRVAIGSKAIDVGEDGRFEVMAPPGEWRVNVRPSPMDASVYAAQIRYGEQDALDAPIVTTETGNPELEIVLADGARKISGRVVGSDDRAVVGALVRCIGKGRGFGTLTDPDGYFRMGNLAPGEYEVEAGEGCSGAKTRVDVSAADAVLNSLRVCKPEAR